MTRSVLVADVQVDWGQEAAERIAEIALMSEPGPGVTRLPFTAQHRQALALLESWMVRAGLQVRLDAAGTLIGRTNHPATTSTFLFGSHQDSVRQGGAYDGIMGVVLPILALERLQSEGIPLPFAVEVLAFADEEGVRFPTALMGPRALAGRFDPAALNMRDMQDISLRQAMCDFGLQPDLVASLRRDPAEILGYLETHIEQGPVLEASGQALGVVTAICGIERHQVRFHGQTGHAGTLPMQGRKDALVGAAAFITEVHRLGCDTDDLRATIGSLQLEPNVVNAVPNQVDLTLELRSPVDAIREDAGHALTAYAQSVAEAHNLTLTMQRSYSQLARPCDETLTRRIERAQQKAGNQGLRLPSGATHDASAMADLCPMAMMFVRCCNGVSHTPEEYVAPEDMGKAIDALCTFLTDLADT